MHLKDQSARGAAAERARAYRDQANAFRNLAASEPLDLKRQLLVLAAGRFEAAIVGSILKDAVSLKSWRAKVALLQARYPQWNPVQKVDMSVEQDRPSPFEELSDEELDTRMDELTRERFGRMTAAELRGWRDEIAGLLATRTTS